MRQTTGLRVHSSEPAMAGAGTAKDTIIFVGSRRSFSGPSLRTVTSEIRDLDAVQCDSLQDCASVAASHSGSLRCIILDARICDDGLADCCDGLARLAGTLQDQGLPGLVLAYWDTACPAIGPFSDMIGESPDCWPGLVQGFLPMAQPLDIWLAVIRLLISGGSHIPAELLKRAEPEPAPAPVPPAKPAAKKIKPDDRVLATLTGRETEVLSLVASGLQNKQIAGRLELSEHTVKLHMHHIIAKLEVKNRTEAAMRFIASAGKVP